MAALGKRTQDALSETVRGASPGTFRRLHVYMLATGPAARTSSILAAATSSTILMCLPAAAPQRRHALCLTERSSSYYPPTPGEFAADAGALRAKPQVGASES
jgi:hypothetical protein